MERPVAPASDGENDRVVAGCHRAANDRGIGNEDGRSARRLLSLARDRERRAAARDDVELLLTGRLLVLLDQRVTFLGGTESVHAERSDVERPADREPLKPLDRLDGRRVEQRQHAMRGHRANLVLIDGAGKRCVGA